MKRDFNRPIFTYEISDEKEIIITGFEKMPKDLYISHKIEGLLVAAIDKMAFIKAKSLESLTIPNSIKRIEAFAFYGSKKLKTVRFDDDSKLKSLEDYTFFGAKSLKSVFLHKSI